MKTTGQKHPYPSGSLYRQGTPRVYRGRELDEIAFPLGGIGTGMISLGGWGQLRDFEIFNRPHKGLGSKWTFFTLFTKKGDERPVTRIIQGPVGGTNFTGDGSGVTQWDGAGLPHFRNVEFVGMFPIARLHFTDPDVALDVTMEAYNPFIPLNADDSSLPVAMFTFELKNPTSEAVQATLFANLENKVGFPEVGGGVIEYLERPGLRGLEMSTAKHAPDSPRFGTLALATPHEDVSVRTRWLRSYAFGPLDHFWHQACQGHLTELRERSTIKEGTDVGSIGLRTVVPPGESIRLPVWIVWHNPNFEKYWGAEPGEVWRNHYATLHQDAVGVAAYVAQHHERLERETKAFAEALFSSTLPEAVLDAVSSQISVLKTPTCIRLEDGTLWGWEGCRPGAGCCEGSCTHVWNYAQALPYLFPALERSMRSVDYSYNLHDDGHMTFRLPLPLGKVPDPDFHAAADGQLGGVMKVYREWLICGDDAWLRHLWPSVKQALEYAWRHWDRDRDGVIEGLQHNTYDIEFAGPNTMIGSFYLGALRAAEEMARALGKEESAEEYRAIYLSGRAVMDATLFNGEYYIQDVRLDALAGAPFEPSRPMQFSDPGVDPELRLIDPLFPNYPKLQIGEGCLSDQLIGQWYARMLRLGDLFDSDHVRSALAAIFRYNWRDDLSAHAGFGRNYALNDEAGLLVASWPRGGRPGLPTYFGDEVWCGIEYQVASHLIYEGLIEEGLAIVKGVRDRHTGTRRNPWNEFECGNHYARSMASYALLLALSDFYYSAPTQLLHFAPRLYQDRFRCFFSIDSAWGILQQTMDHTTTRAVVEVVAGALRLRQLSIGLKGNNPHVSLAGKEVKFTHELTDTGMVLGFHEPVAVKSGESLVIDFQE
jgi:non-lysosomal glucosylceramidase